MIPKEFRKDIGKVVKELYIQSTKMVMEIQSSSLSVDAWWDIHTESVKADNPVNDICYSMVNMMINGEEITKKDLEIWAQRVFLYGNRANIVQYCNDRHSKVVKKAKKTLSDPVNWN